MLLCDAAGPDIGDQIFQRRGFANPIKKGLSGWHEPIPIAVCLYVCRFEPNAEVLLKIQGGLPRPVTITPQNSPAVATPTAWWVSPNRNEPVPERSVTVQHFWSSTAVRCFNQALKFIGGNHGHIATCAPAHHDHFAVIYGGRDPSAS